MKLKILLPVVVFLSLLLAACDGGDRISCRIYCGEELFLDKSYSLPLRQSLAKKRYKSLRAYYESTDLTPLDFLRKLNKNLAEDVESCSEKNVEKTEATFTYEGDGKFSYAEGAPGRVARIDLIATALIENDGVFSGQIPFRPLPPVTTTEELKKHTEKITSFSTDYSSSSPERKHNIALATKKLDDLTVEARQTISFNQTVGPRTKENGYKEAVVISFGQFTRGVGGGVCQVSTTLYNAWEKAGLDATGKNHSLTVSYVPIGLDAMVSDQSDLLLTNSSDYPVFLDAEFDDEKLTFTVYGTRPEEDIRLWSEKVKEYPCDEYELVYGEEDKVLSEPKDGLLYRSYRDFYKNGRLTRRETLRLSEYKKVKGKKIVTRKIEE